jgi:hypothetical protein
MRSDLLHIVTAVANPIRWKSRLALARSAVASWLKEPNVAVTLVECAYGGRDYELADLAGPRVTHVPVRAFTLAWNKENLLNIGVSRLPADAAFIGAFDADIAFRKSGWANEVIAALDLYPVVQPWQTAYDLGPNDSHLQTHTSFASLWHGAKPVVALGPKFWKFQGGPYDYSHSGYAWAWQRRALDLVGGLFEDAGMGSGDHVMALALVGAADRSFPGHVAEAYRKAVMTWQARALTHVNLKLGFVPGTIEHSWHGSKARRQYVDRWDMFLEHGFDPSTDLKRNTFGVIEFAGNKPALEAAFDRYLRSREEDGNLAD